MAQLSYRPLEVGDHWLPAISTYRDLLQRHEWKRRRIGILYRDNYVCTECKMFATYNHKGAAFDVKEIGMLPDRQPLYEFIQTPIPICLHIHHKYYVLSRNPWDYEDDALICLCGDCHSIEHQKNTIFAYWDESAKKSGYSTKEYSVCPKCGGNGFLSEFNYHMDGKCFGCNGYCFVRNCF